MIRRITRQRLLQVVMILNAVFFLAAATEHAGAAIGPFREPTIIPATIVEIICGVSLAWGAAAVMLRSGSRWRVALITNLVALAGVLLGIAALAAGRGPRTASNDVHHGIMLTLIITSLAILFFGRKGD
jgi:hypothetical protein